MGIVNYVDIKILERAAYSGDITKQEIMKDFRVPRSTALTAIGRLKTKHFIEKIGFQNRIRYLITNLGWDYLQLMKK